MKATFNQIVDNLVKVLTDNAESAQYFNNNEQYICMCGWCGTMSPASRPAYIKTFGKDTTEEAEAKAREIIAEKEAARQRTKYAQHAKEADRLEGVPAVGGSFWADNSGLKCDGGRGLFEELHNLNYYTSTQNTPARLCCVDEVIQVSEEDFARPRLADELVKAHALKGGSRSEDVDDNEDMNAIYNHPEKMATFYTVGVLVVSPSGKYFLIDSEGYDYARYIYVPIEWPVLLADEVARVKAEEEARKAEEERQAAEEKAQLLASYRTRCGKWLHLMKDVGKMEAGRTATPAQLRNARKANIMAMCRAAFPGVKFSLKVRKGWGADFDLEWTDGPTLEEFRKNTDLALFCSRRDTFNGWDDSTDVEYSEFVEFARFAMGSNGGDIALHRRMSDDARQALMDTIFAAAPAAGKRDKYGYTEAHMYSHEEAAALADALGTSDIFPTGYEEHAEVIARRAWNLRSYTKTTTPEPTATTPTKRTEAASAQDAAQTDETPAEGLELVETAEGVAVVGDSRTTYRNRKAIKAHGARWNKEAQQWQASEPEVVARLRAWFGVSTTPTAEEGDTEHESEQPGSKNPLDALRARLYALNALGVEVSDLLTIAANISPESVGERSATSCALEAIQRLNSTADRRVAQVGVDATLCEADEITATAPTDTAEDFATVLTADRLELLHSAAADFDRLTQAGEHIAAVNARLSALFACGVDVADLVQRADYKADQRARQRAAAVLTADEFRTLYGCSKEEHAA